MIVDPKQVLEEGHVTGLESDKQVQQNGIDLRIDRLYRIRGAAYLGKDKKVMPNFDEVHPRKNAETGNMVFDLAPDQAYAFDTCEGISVPEDMMALLVTRSTLNRCGVRITSGCYDSGFKSDSIGGFINTAAVPVFIEKGSRVAQIVFYVANTSSTYNGQYQGGNSTSVGN